MVGGGGWVDQAITNPISGPSLSFVFCLLALSLTKWCKSPHLDADLGVGSQFGPLRKIQLKLPQNLPLCGGFWSSVHLVGDIFLTF